MAVIGKFTNAAASKQLFNHNYRLNSTYGNSDIDLSKTHLNYSLTPYLKIRSHANKSDRQEMARLEKQRYAQRKSECFCLNRADVKTWAGCIVTAPQELHGDKEKQDLFFRAVADFLTNRYGEKNTISIVVHYDEMSEKHIKNASGEVIVKKALGEPHLHYCWIPTTKIDHEALKKKKRPVKEMFDYNEKISAKEVLTKKELQSFHPDLQAYLDDNLPFSVAVATGKTARQGGNRTVAQLKRETEREFSALQNYVKELEQENQRLHNRIKELEAEREVSRTDTWGRSSDWGSGTWDRDEERNRW